MSTQNTQLPTDSQARKDVPLCSGALDYFPAALAAVAELSRIGNDKHNPGEPLHWARGKSDDHADCIARHQLERGTIDTDNVRHSTKVAWRALAQLQVELEEAGAPLARGARVVAEPTPRAWNEGWRCTGCDSTTLWSLYQYEGDLAANIAAGDKVLCANIHCLAGMVRDA